MLGSPRTCLLSWLCHPTHSPHEYCVEFDGLSAEDPSIHDNYTKISLNIGFPYNLFSNLQLVLRLLLINTRSIGDYNFEKYQEYLRTLFSRERIESVQIQWENIFVQHHYGLCLNNIPFIMEMKTV